MKILVFLRYFLALIVLQASGVARAIDAMALVPPSGAADMPKTYFGLHIHDAEKPGHWPQVPFGTWRLMDAYVIWPNLQPERDKWDFSRLDGHVARARSLGVELILPLAMTPTWASARPNEKAAYGNGHAAEPANLNDWRTYVRTVATRYRGQITAYEIWNEVTEKMFWTGTTQQLVEMTHIAFEEIKRQDPDAKVIAPSGVGLDRRTSWPRKFLDAGGAKWVDVISFHLYHGPHAPEFKISALLKMRADLEAGGYGRLPIWNTESGYLTETAFNGRDDWSDDERKYRQPVTTVASYVVRDFLLARAMGYEKFVWYAWDSIKYGLQEPSNQQVRESGVVYGNAVSFLMRSVLERCDRDRDGVWVCRMKLANGKTAQIIWLDPKADVAPSIVRTAPFAGWQRFFDGRTEKIIALGERVTLSSNPVLLEQGQ